MSVWYHQGLFAWTIRPWYNSLLLYLVWIFWVGVRNGLFEDRTRCLKCSADPTCCHIYFSRSSHHSPAEPTEENTSVPSHPICSVTLLFWVKETSNMFQKNIIRNNPRFCALLKGTSCWVSTCNHVVTSTDHWTAESYNIVHSNKNWCRNHFQSIAKKLQVKANADSHHITVKWRFKMFSLRKQELTNNWPWRSFCFK